MKNNKILRKRKPIIALICEGRNQTETQYFNHFNKRDNSYNLKIYSSEATDPKSMIKKARNLIEELQLDSSIGDKMFCLIDVDLSPTQFEKILQIKGNKSRKKLDAELVLSNPCFEVWLLYYFTENPSVESSSKNVKKQLQKIVPKYVESYDIIEEEHLGDKHSMAMNRAIRKNENYEENMPIIEKNPYTEIPNLLSVLINFDLLE